MHHALSTGHSAQPVGHQVGALEYPCHTTIYEARTSTPCHMKQGLLCLTCTPPCMYTLLYPSLSRFLPVCNPCGPPCLRPSLRSPRPVHRRHHLGVRLPPAHTHCLCDGDVYGHCDQAWGGVRVSLALTQSLMSILQAVLSRSQYVGYRVLLPVCRVPWQPLVLTLTLTSTLTLTIMVAINMARSYRHLGTKGGGDEAMQLPGKAIRIRFNLAGSGRSLSDGVGST